MRVRVQKGREREACGTRSGREQGAGEETQGGHHTLLAELLNSPLGWHTRRVKFSRTARGNVGKVLYFCDKRGYLLRGGGGHFSRWSS